MKVRKRIKGFQVESHAPAKWYDVDLKKKLCSCPHFMYRLRAQGGECKHIKAVRDWVSSQVEKKGKGILQFIKEKGEIESVELIRQYGESIVNDLIANGEIAEEKGKVRLI
jgi:hypothetical protein